MRARTRLLAATCLAAPLFGAHAASAQQVSGFYIGAGAGVNLLETEQILNFGNLLQIPVAGKPKIKFDVGYAGVGSAGYGFGNGMRVEIEGNFRNNSIRGIGGLTAQHGDSEKYGAMVNALYDFDLTAYYGITAFTPYVGVGAGYAFERIDGLRATDGVTQFRSNHGSDQFAYQGIAGVAFPLTGITPGLSVTAEYRFYGTPHDAQYVTSVTADGVTFKGKLKVADDLNHSIMVGLRYAFDTEVPAPPPAPAPTAAPAPQPTRTYLVFFDWDRADLTARAKQIIADAATNAGRVTYTRIEVSGHADRSGTPQYNQGLSLRRAQNVASELVHDGVRQNMIDIHAYGDTKPLVPTAAGVREPQNRRVEIVIR
jgi:outer membrane protein OmpA-like peptidoglycan-associated protein